MKPLGFDEVEPRIILCVVLCAVGGSALGALPGALITYFVEGPNDLAQVALIVGLATGAVVGALAGSTALLVAAYRGRRHRHSSAGTRYQPETVSRVP